MPWRRTARTCESAVRVVGHAEPVVNGVSAPEPSNGTTPARVPSPAPEYLPSGPTATATITPEKLDQSLA
jgi:hypothetical protein